MSFSAGKDSTVMLHMVADEARKRGRKFGCLFIDLEAQYSITIEHAARCYEMHADVIEPHWLALPIALRNAVSAFEPKWLCWDPERESDWVRPRHRFSTGNAADYPFFRSGMEFEELIEVFGDWYGGGKLTACLVGIRADESLNRWRTVAGNKHSFEGRKWTTWKGRSVYNVYPIYDWRTEDIWRYHGKYPDKPHNRLYDLMHKAGLTLHQMRICQPYGDDQRKGLWLYHLIEPKTWSRVVARVNGANGGALYAQESGNALGRIKISKPDGHTWESFAKLLLASMPPKTRDHFEDKIAVFINWWRNHGPEHGYDCNQGIPDELDRKIENAAGGQRGPSWRRICKTLLKLDYWCKGLSFTQTSSQAYERYKRIMKKRRQRWGIFG